MDYPLIKWYNSLMNIDEFRIYSDESSHLGKSSDFMIIGAIWCSINEVRNFTDKNKIASGKTRYS